MKWFLCELRPVLIMAYSRWSDSVWYTYWADYRSDDGTERLAIHWKGGIDWFVVWDGHNPHEMTDEDIANCVQLIMTIDMTDRISLDTFTSVTEEERKELVNIVREFYEDVYSERIV